MTEYKIDVIVDDKNRVLCAVCESELPDNDEIIVEFCAVCLED